MHFYFSTFTYKRGRSGRGGRGDGGEKVNGNKIFKFYLQLGRTPFISNEKKITLSIDQNFFFEPSTFRRFFLHVRSRQVPMNQRRFSRR